MDFGGHELALEDTTGWQSFRLGQGLPRRLLGGDGIAGGGELSAGQQALYAIICVLFVCGSGIASGLTLGLMSLDVLELKVLMRSGTPKEQKLATRILPILEDPHWLLVTLLLCNAACFEALPIFLDVLVDPVGAILISVTLILLFGEILPQAVCARHGLRIGAALGWLVRIMMWLFCPIAWPMARALDWLLGKEGYTMFRRKQLKALVDLHGADEGLGGKLTDDEVQIICGALDLTNKVAFSAMTPLDKVVMLSTEQRIDAPTIATILASGHSRVPVYAGHTRDHIVGLLLVKELLKLVPLGPDAPFSPSEPALVSMLNLRPLPRLPANTPMYALLKLFQTGRAHMVLLTQPEPSEEVQGTAVAVAAASSPSLPPTKVHVASGSLSPLNLQAEGPSVGKRRAKQQALALTAADHLANGSGGNGAVPAAAEANGTAPTVMGAAEHSTVVGAAGRGTSNAATEASSDGPAITTVVLGESPTLHDHHAASATQHVPGPMQLPSAFHHPVMGAPVAGYRSTPPAGDASEHAAAPAGESHTSEAPTSGTPNQSAAATPKQSVAVTGEHPQHGPTDSPSVPRHHKKDKQQSSTLGRISARLSKRLKRKRSGAASHSGSSSSSDSSSSSEDGSDDDEEEIAPVPQIAKPGEPIGIITIEDVLEELMGQEILDETDTFADNECTITVDEEMRSQLAERLPEPLRNLVMASATAGTIRRLSKTPLSRHSAGGRPASNQLARTLTGQMGNVASNQALASMV